MKVKLIVISLLLLATNAFAAHVEGTSYNDIVYLLSSSPNKIVRYDMSSEAWLTDINLPIIENADAIAVDDSGIYVAYDRIIYRYDLSGQSQTHVANTSTSINDLITVGGFLAIAEYRYITIVDKGTFSVTATNSSYTSTYLGTGLSSANGMLRIFGRSTGVSPSDIGHMEIDNTGAIVSSGDSPHHGDYPGASKTWVFPDESRVVDNAGIIYSTQSLSYLGSFAGSFDKLTFVGDLPVLLRGEELIVYSNTFLESGTYALASSGVDEVFSTDSAVFVFEEGYSVQKVLLSAFSTLEPGEPIDPSGLQYTPDAYAYDNDDNIVFLLSRIHASVFRWSINNGNYLESIPLLGVPEYMSVDTESNILYLAYQSGKINKIDLNEPELVEQHFTSLPQPPLGLANIGGFVFSADASGAWESHYTYAPDGTLISAVDWNYPSREYVWNEVNQRIYFFRDGSSPNDLLWEEINSTTGEIGTKQDSPYHSSTGILMPIRVAPDGSVVVLGSGRIYDAVSLAQINTLPNDILDAVWIYDLLVTFKANTVSANIQMWTSSYAPDGSFSMPGDPLRMFSVNDKLLLIRSVVGVPTFDLLDLDTDSDGDGIGDNADTDDDNDGIPDELDPTPLMAGYWPSPAVSLLTATFSGALVVDADGVRGFIGDGTTGDEVTVFDGTGVLCGRAIVGVDGSYVITVYGDDPATTTVDEGADEGETLTFRMWDNQRQKELPVRALQPDESRLNLTWSDNGGGSVNLHALAQQQIGMFRPNTAHWYVDADGNGNWGGLDYFLNDFGMNIDKAAVGDWNGDGFTDPGVFRARGDFGWWYFDANGSGAWETGIDQGLQFGLANDAPAVGDWNGDGKSDFGVFRVNGIFGWWYFDSNGNRQWDPGVDQGIQFGMAGDIPVVGDWNGDGKSDFGVFRVNGIFGWWYLDSNGNRQWDPGVDQAIQFGMAGDIPVEGDWNGDGISDFGVMRNEIWYLDGNGNRLWDPADDLVYPHFGMPGDQPVSGVWR